MYSPGDFILVSGTRLGSRLIQLGQALRTDRRYCRWNHAALIIDANGTLVEASLDGVHYSNIGRYGGCDVRVVPIDADWDDRVQATSYAVSQVGESYGWIAALSVALRCLIGGSVAFLADGSHICSGLVACALERCGYTFDRSPEHVTPAELAAYFNVR